MPPWWMIFSYEDYMRLTGDVTLKEFRPWVKPGVQHQRRPRKAGSKHLGRQ